MVEVRPRVEIMISFSGRVRVRVTIRDRGMVRWLRSGSGSVPGCKAVRVLVTVGAGAWK